MKINFYLFTARLNIATNCSKIIVLNKIDFNLLQHARLKLDPIMIAGTA